MAGKAGRREGGAAGLVARGVRKEEEIVAGAWLAFAFYSCGHPSLGNGASYF